MRVTIFVWVAIDADLFDYGLAQSIVDSGRSTGLGEWLNVRVKVESAS